MRGGEEKQGPGPGFVDGAFELLLELPHVADARVVVGRRLPVLGLAACSRLLGLHHLKKKKKIKMRAFCFHQTRGFDFPPVTNCLKRILLFFGSHPLRCMVEHFLPGGVKLTAVLLQ